MQDNAMWYVPTVYTLVIDVVQPYVQNFFPVDDYNFPTEQLAYMSVNNK
jgi:hypothetical protein